MGGDQESGQTLRSRTECWGETRRAAKHSGAGRSGVGSPGGWRNTQQPSGVVGGDQEGGQTLRSREEWWAETRRAANTKEPGGVVGGDQ